MNALLTFNILLDTEIQLKAAASPRRLCSGQRQRYAAIMKPRTLNRIAAFVMLVPLSVWIVAECLIRFIPGCKAQMYGENICFVGGVNLAAPLLIAGIAGIALFVVLTVLVALPLFIRANVLSNRVKRRANVA